MEFGWPGLGHVSMRTLSTRIRGVHALIVLTQVPILEVGHEVGWGKGQPHLNAMTICLKKIKMLVPRRGMLGRYKQ